MGKSKKTEKTKKAEDTEGKVESSNKESHQMENDKTNKEASGDQESHFDISRRISHLIQTYAHTQQWIVQADTKGGFLLTINGVVAGFMINRMGKFARFWAKADDPSWILWAIVIAFSLYLICQVHSFLYTAWIFLPRPTKMSREHLRRTRHVFNYSLALNFPTLDDGDKLREEYTQLTEKELLEEYLLQLHIDSIVCTKKYGCFRIGFQSMLLGLAFGALAFLGTTFMV